MLWKPGRLNRSRADQLFATLREQVVDGTRPPGSSLSIGELVAEYGVNRLTARDALQRLGVGGLLAVSNGGTTVVADADLDEARDAQLVVGQMHRLAALLAVPRLTRGDIDVMRRAQTRFAAAMRQRDVTEALAADVVLHDVPVQVCGNQTVIAVLDQFQPLIVRLERMRFETWDIEDAVAQHDRFVELCAAREAVAAADFAEEMWHSLDDAMPTQFVRRTPATTVGQPVGNPAGPAVGHTKSSHPLSMAPSATAEVSG